MSMGDYSGDYKSSVFKMLLSYFDFNLETLSKTTGFTESHLDSILRQDTIDKSIGKRILTAMTLTNNDYYWLSIVIEEIKQDRQQRFFKLEEIRSNQRQLQLERQQLEEKQERVKKDVSKSKEKTTKNKTVNKGRRRRDTSSKEKDNIKKESVRSSSRKESKSQKRKVFKRGSKKDHK